MNRFASFLTFICAVLLLGGCGESYTNARLNPAPELYKKVVSLSPSSTDICQTLTYITLVGRTSQCSVPPVSKAIVVMNGLKPDYEKIMSVSPDAIVYDHDLISETDLAKFKEMKIPTFDTGGADNTVNAFITRLREFAKYTHGETANSAYIDRITKEINSAKGNAVTPKPRIAVLLGGGGAEHMIAGKNSFVADIVRQAQSEPIGPDAKNFVGLNAEWLKSADPDVIVVPGDASSVTNDPRFKTLKAITKGRVISFDADLLLRRGSRVESAIKNLNVSVYQTMNKN
ncbi:MAG: helical backbone metal receptor [Fimbriimonadaceae bacterium]